MAAAVVGWLVWAVLCLVIGRRLLAEPQTETDVGELLRVLGFAAAPGIVQALGVFAPFRTPVIAVAQLWMILAMVVGVRQALDYSGTLRAFVVCALGWLAQVAVVVALLAIVQPAAVPDHAPVTRPAEPVPTAGYLGIVKPSGVAPPVE
jgi:hypothetical protein